MATYTNWVHGSDVNINQPDNVDRFHRTSSGTKVVQDADTFNRFYFAIPTPTVISNDQTIEIEVVYLHARLSGAVIERVTVHEAAVEIFREDTKIQGDEIQRAFDLRGRITQPKLIRSAINFGVEINFAEETGESVDTLKPEVTLIAAGAQFDTSPLIGPAVEEGKVLKGTLFVNSG